jgi:hypothetical protein
MIFLWARAIRARRTREEAGRGSRAQ